MDIFDKFLFSELYNKEDEEFLNKVGVVPLTFSSNSVWVTSTHYNNSNFIEKCVEDIKQRFESDR